MMDVKKELFANAYKNRIPLTATIEIISECNFRCVHCYVDNNFRKDILTYEEIIDFGNQIINMGCLYVILTGGEVLLHPDFKRIYEFFVLKGICVSVFTNGSLIDESIIKLFVKYPPRVVEITMYGFSADTYKKVAKSNMYDIVKNNILLLTQNGINVLLKMFVLSLNYCDFYKIREFALENSIPFKYDSRIIAPLDSSEIKYQLHEKDAIELELARFSTVKKYNEYTYEYIVDKRYNKVFQCGAGRISCWLKSNNHFRICNFLSNFEFDMKKYKVAEVWNLISNYIEKKIDENSKCYNCKYRNYCDFCPAISYVTFQNADMINQHNLYCKKAEMRALYSKNKEANSDDDLSNTWI